LSAERPPRSRARDDSYGCFRAFYVSGYGDPCPGNWRMGLIATIDDPSVIRKILAHLGLPPEVPERARAPRPALGDGWLL